jgi:hypothetical protein
MPVPDNDTRAAAPDSQPATQAMSLPPLQPPSLREVPPATRPPEPEELSLGEDLTRPTRRIDSRLQYQDIRGGNDRYIWTTRFERPVELADHWNLGVRADFPVIVGNDVFSSKTDSGYYPGIGDVLTQVALVNKIDARWTWAFGSQLIFPTATEREFGGGKYRAVPSGGFRLSLPEISPGSYTSLLLRYDVDYAGQRGRSDVSVFQVGPELNVKLSRNWYVDFYPNSEIRYNCLTQKWFVPIDVQIGRRVFPNVVASLEGSYAIIKDYDLYNFKVEFRVGVFY